MKKLVFLSLLCGCDWYFRPPDTIAPDGNALLPDAAQVRADAGACLTEAERTNDCQFAWTGSTVDFVSGDLENASVGLHTAWDNIPFFPFGCAPLDVFDGTAGTADLPCDSPQFPPVVLFITGSGPMDGWHPFAVDARLTCPSAGAPCDALAMDLPTVADAVALDWRLQLSDDGMLGAQGGGLAIVQFLESDGSPAAGVAPTVLADAGERLLTPASEVRFLAADRLSLVRFDAAFTGASGLAIVHLPQQAALIGGVRGEETWEPIGVLFADGHIFFEERTVSP